MGEVTGLRLELGRERDRANALAGALHKEVVAVIRRAVADVDTIGAQLVELDDVKAENARLRGQVRLLTEAGERMARYIARGSPRKCWIQDRQCHELSDWAHLVNEDPFK